MAASFSSDSPPQQPMSSPPPTTLALPAPTPKSGSNSKLKSPPVPWSHQETLALIQAYQDKWYSLKKGQLKAFQWEEVAAAVPSKTSTQCRHKIEKLRKRYRSELPKPYPESWQYFHLMDQMERGPNAAPMNVRPVSVFKSPASAPDRNGGNSSNPNPRFANVIPNSNSPSYYNNGSRVDDDGESDESDEEWNMDAARRNKSKSINNIVRGGDVRSAVRAVRAINRSSGHENDRFGGALRNQVNGKGRQFYAGDDSDDDEDDDLEDETEALADEEEEDGGQDSGGGRELAAQIRGFAESFMKMENHKVEMMRETERNRMEMEKKRMEMILGAQRKMVDTIGRAFAANKRPRTNEDT